LIELLYLRFDALSREGSWKLLERRGPVPYLPENPEYGDKVQTVLFAFRVPKNEPGAGA